MRNSAYTPRSVAHKASQTPRTIIALLIAMLLPLGAWALGGSGTSSSPYTIANAADLVAFANKVNGTEQGAYAKLTADITLTSAWAAMGTSSKPYTGTFDGQGHTISGLNLTATAANAGLFGYVNNATIKDFTLAGSISSNSDNVGSVVGTANGSTKIYNVYSSVNIKMTAAKNHIGGIMGQALQVNDKTVEIKGCTYSGTMNLGSSTDSNGGMVGYCGLNANIEIENCFFSGSISSSGSNPRIGGILGYADDDGSTQNFKYIRNCFCDGTLSPSTGEYVGIFAGYPRGKVKDVISNNTYVSTASTNMAGNSTQTTAANNGCKKITISVTANANGTVSQTYVNPTSTTATQLKLEAAVTTEGYYFTKWSDNVTTASRNVALTSSIDLTARFDNKYTITLGNVTNGKIAQYGGNSSGSYAYGTNVTIEATPNDGYHFVKWNDGNTNKSRMVTVTQNVTYTATFAAHTYGSPAWTWTGTSAASAKITCTACSNEISGSATITSKVKIAATCDVKGTTTYTAKVTLNGTERTDAKDVQNIAALGHSYGSPVWTWADDGKTASAKITCSRNSSHIISGNATITSNVKTASTCTVKGTTTYTAKVTLNGSERTATKDVQDIAALGHSMTEHAHVAATCTADGNEAYWTCSRSCCAGKYFQDVNGAAEWGSLPTIASPGHQVDANGACTVCGKTPEGKAVLAADGTLTFSYGIVNPGEYALNTGNTKPGWSRSAIKSVVFDPSFDVVRPTTCNSWFDGCAYLTNITGLEYLHTEEVKSMYAMFMNCSHLESIDLSSFNTKSVTDFRSMFFKCSKLKSLTIGNFNIYDYAYITGMFTDCSSLTTLTMKSIPYLKNGTFDTQFTGDGKTVNLILDENSVIYNGTTYLPTITNCNHFHYTSAHQDATCTEEGFDSKACKYCKFELENTTIPVLGHSMTAHAAVAATCATPGNEAYWTCSHDCCHDKHFKDGEGSAEWGAELFIAALGHDMTSHDYVAATCNTGGNGVYYTCSRDCCKDMNFKDSDGMEMWGDELYTAALGHDFSYVYSDVERICTPATCISQASYYYSCSRCYESEHNPDHTFTRGGYDAHQIADNGICSACHVDFNESKVVFADGTLTFYHDAKEHTGDTYQLINLIGWRKHNSELTTVVFDPSFAAARPTSCAYWFVDFVNLSQITGIENLNTSEVTDMSYMFYNCQNLSSLDLSHFNTEKVTDMNSMFNQCQKLASLDISNFNTSAVTNMRYMFNDCQNLTSLDLSHFNTEKVTDMNSMFSQCKKLALLDISSFNTSAVTDMSYMFYGCKNLSSLDLSSFNTSAVTDMSYMFYYCDQLQSLTIGNFDMQKVTDCTSMLYVGSYNLKTLTLKSLPFLQDGTFNTEFTGDGKTVNLVLDENSVIYKGINYLPAFTNCNHYHATPMHVDATCTVDGYDAKHCSYCQLEFDKTNIQLALGHDYCISHGEWSDDYTQCTLVLTCRHDNSHSDRIGATVESTVETPATCTTKGTTRYSASAYNYDDCQLVDDIPALGHLLGDDCEVLRESTCAVAGWGRGYCSRCEKEVEGELPKGDHTFAFEDVNHDECTVCGHTFMHFVWSDRSPAFSINTNGEFKDSNDQILNYTIVVDKEEKEGYIDFEGKLSDIYSNAIRIDGYLAYATFPGTVTYIGEEVFNLHEIPGGVYCRAKEGMHIDIDAFKRGTRIYVPKAYYDWVAGSEELCEKYDFCVKYCDLTDDAPTIHSTDYSAGDLTYTRGTSAPAKDSYATFCLPFDIALEYSSCIEAAYVPLKVAFYDESTGMLNLFFREIKDYVTAGTPFVARMTGQDIKLFNILVGDYKDVEDPQNTDLSVYNYTGTQGVMFDNTSMSLTFGGTYEKFFDSNLNTFNTNGSFGHSDYVSPFRSYVKINTGDDRVKGFNAFFVGTDDDVEDCIEKIEAGTATPDAFYNLGGARITKPINGLYIHNGKKYIKK